MQDNDHITIVFYFGKEQIRPSVYSDFTPIIKQISFLGKDLVKFDHKDDKVTFADYIEMIKFVEVKDLCFKSVVCSENTAFIIDAKDELWVFGEGGHGQLGIGMLKPLTRQPINLKTFKLYSWGNTEYGSQGQLFPHRFNLEPEKVKKNRFTEYIPEDQKSGMKITHVTAGPNYSIVCVNKTHLFAFGKEEKSRLGLGQFNIDYTDRVYKIDLPFSNMVIKGIACGRNHSILWDTDGQIYSWGDASEGKLGHSSQKGGYDYMVVNPQKIKALEGQQIIQASCGYNHSCAINFKGEIYAWGKTVHSKGEDQGTKIDYLRPKKLSCYIKSEHNIQVGSHIVKISTYGNSNAAVDDKGYVYTWGKNTNNCLGHIDPKDYNFPVCIEELVGTRCIDVACGEEFTVVIASEGVNKLAYYKMKEFYSGILENAKEKVNKIKNFYAKKLQKTEEQKLKEARPVEQDIESLHAAALQKLSNQSTRAFNIPMSEVKKSEKPSLNIQRAANDKNAEAKSESFHINRRIRQADRQLKITRGEFKGFSNTNKKERKPLLLNREFSTITTDVAELTKEMVLDSVTQQMQIDDDEYLLHDETKKVEEKKQVKNDPRVFEKEQPKGVLVSSIFKEQIDLIYKEYSYNDKKENLQEKFLKNMRNKKDDFEKARLKTDSSIRNKFKEAREMTQSLNGGEDWISESSTVLNTVSTVFKRPGTAGSTMSGFFSGGARRISRPESSLKALQTSRSSLALNIPPGDFLKKPRHALNTVYLDLQKEKLMQASVLRDFRTELAKKKKKAIEDEKQQARDQKRIEFYMKSREYQERQEEEKRIQKNTDSVRLNWMIYMNAELIAIALRKIAQLGINTLQKRFYERIKMKKIQFQIRDFLIRKKIKRLTPKQIFIMRTLIQQWVKRKQEQKKREAARLIVFHCAIERIQKRLRVKISIKRYQIVFLQHFLRWGRKFVAGQLKSLSMIWDMHILYLMRQQLTSRSIDSKQMDHFKSNYHQMLIRYGTLNIGDPSLASSLNPTARSSVAASMTQLYQMERTSSINQPLHPLNVNDFQTIPLVKIEDFDTYMKGKSSKDKKQSFRKIHKNSSVGQIDENNESLQDIIKRKAQANTMFNGLLGQLKFKAKGNDDNQNGDQANDKNATQNRRNVLFNEHGSNHEEKNNQKHKSILKRNMGAADEINEGSSSSDSDSDGNNSSGSLSRDHQLVPMKSKKSLKQKQGFSYSRTILPFSQHYFDILLPSNYGIRIDAMRTDPLMAVQIAQISEESVKMIIIQTIKNQMRKRYKKQLVEYQNKRSEFTEANKHLINLERAKIMLQTPTEILQAIHKRENVQRQQKIQKVQLDHLPFAELKQIIADRLPNAPKKPQFKLTITLEQFKISFHRYVEMMRRIIQELESKGVFAGRKKKDQTGNPKKSKVKIEDDTNTIDPETTIHRASEIIKTFEPIFMSKLQDK